MSRRSPTADSLRRAPAHFAGVNAVDCHYLRTPPRVNPGAIDGGWKCGVVFFDQLHRAIDLLLLGEALCSPVDDNAAPVLEIADFFHFASRLLDCRLYTSFSSRLLWKCICSRLGSRNSVMLVTKVRSSASKILIIIIIIFISQPTVFIGRAIGLCFWVSITWKYDR